MNNNIHKKVIIKEFQRIRTKKGFIKRLYSFVPAYQRHDSIEKTIEELIPISQGEYSTLPLLNGKDIGYLKNFYKYLESKSKNVSTNMAKLREEISDLISKNTNELIDYLITSDDQFIKVDLKFDSPSQNGRIDIVFHIYNFRVEYCVEILRFYFPTNNLRVVQDTVYKNKHIKRGATILKKIEEFIISEDNELKN